MSTHTSFILKVLSGANTGATVRLKTGTIVIGRNMSNDIILHDDNIADQHIQLIATSNGVTLQPLVQPVFVDGSEVGLEGINLKPYQIVRIGNVEFLITDGKADKNRLPNKSKPTAKTKQTVNNSPFTTPQPTQTLPPVQRQTNGKTYLLAGLGLLILANLIYAIPQVEKWFSQSSVFISPESRANSLLTSLGQKDFKLIEQPSGLKILRGYVNTTNERNDLIRKIKQAGINANIQIWSQEELVDSATTVARSLGETAINFVAGDKAGLLLGQGFVSTAAMWEQIKSTILGDISGVQEIDAGKVNSIDSFLASFMQFVEKKGLSSRIKVTTDGKRVIVKGELTQQEIEQLKAVRQEFISSYENSPDVVLNVSDIRDRVKLAIRSVSVGKVPFLVAKDGKKYMEGSALGENYFVKSIKPDYVVLTNNGKDIPFYYAIEAGKNDAANRAKLEE